ncbi:MAG: TolC family protein [Bacteroidia bacterium]
MKKLLTLFFAVLIAGTARPQSQDSLYRFSLKQAIDFALQNQKDVLNAQLDAEISDAQVKEIVGIGLPQLSGSLDVKDFEKIPTQFIPDFISPSVYGILFNENVIPRKELNNSGVFPVQFGTRWNATAGLTASQLLFDPTYLLGVKATKTVRELSQKNVKRTRIETAVNVSKAYYNVLLLQERKKVIAANVERIQKLKDDTKALYDNGFVEKLDLDRVTVLYNNITTENDKFDRLLALSSQVFLFQIGANSAARVELTDSLNASEIKNTVVPIDKTDPSKRIEYSLLKTQEKLQQYNVKRYVDGYYPNLVAYGSLSTSAQRNKFDFFDSDQKWYPTGVVGATLNVPIFDGFQKAAKIRQQKLALRKIENELVNFEQAINLDINSNRNALIDALSALDIQDKNLTLANDIYRTSKLKYDQGVGSNLEVLDAETSLKEAQANYFNALYDATVARINLDKALGNLNY